MSLLVECVAAAHADFEIADLRWMRSEAYQTFFRHLAETNGFF